MGITKITNGVDTIKLGDAVTTSRLSSTRSKLYKVWQLCLVINVTLMMMMVMVMMMAMMMMMILKMMMMMMTVVVSGGDHREADL